MHLRSAVSSTLIILACSNLTGCTTLWERFTNVVEDSMIQSEDKLKAKVNEDEKEYGKDSAQVRDDCRSLGKYFYEQEAYIAAEPWLARCLQLDRKLGDERWRTYHDDVLRTANNFYYSGKYELAEVLFQEAIGLSKKNTEDGSEDYDDDLSSAASNYYYWGNYAEADRLYKQILEMRKKHYSSKSEKLRQAYKDIADNLHAWSRPAEALEYYNKALELSQKTAPKGKDSLDILEALADNYYSWDRLKPALEYYNKALELAKTGMGANSPEALAIMRKLTTYYSENSELKTAINNQEKILQLFLSRTEKDPTEETDIHLELARLFQKTDNKARAQSEFELAVKSANQVGDNGSKSLATKLEFAGFLKKIGKLALAEILATVVLNGYSGSDFSFSDQDSAAETMRSEGFSQNAAVLVQRAAETVRVRDGANSIEYADALMALAYCDELDQKWIRAIEGCEAALAIYKEKLPPDSDKVVEVLWKLSDLEFGNKELELAEKHLQEGLSLAIKNMTPGSVQVAEMYEEVADMYDSHWGDRDKAQNYLEKGLALRRKGARDEALRDALIALADTMSRSDKQGDLKNACTLYDEAASPLYPGESDPSVQSSALLNHALLLENLEKYQQAKAKLEKAKQLIEQDLGENSGSFAIAVRHLASVSAGLKDYPHARQYYAQAVELHKKGVWSDEMSFEQVSKEIQELPKT